MDEWLADEGDGWVRTHGASVWVRMALAWQREGVSPSTVEEFDALVADHVGACTAQEAAVQRDAPFWAFRNLADRWVDLMPEVAPDAQRWRDGLADGHLDDGTWDRFLEGFVAGRPEW